MAKYIKKQVKVIKVVHYQSYGSFFLLSNMSVWGYFNNGQILKYDKKQEGELSNEQKILAFVSKAKFQDGIRKQLVKNTFVNNQQCIIFKAILVKNTLFIRLSNGIIQVFACQIGVQLSQSYGFQEVILANYNPENAHQIKIIRNQETTVYQHFQLALKSKDMQIAEYFQQTLQVMLNNSMASLKFLNNNLKK